MGQNILLIEDEEGIRDFLSDILEDAGFSVSAAADGMEGLWKVQNGTYDLVLLDIMLPKIDGRAVLELIRKQSAVPVIFLTALGSETNQLQGFDLGADDYIVKPSTAALIVKRVQATLRRCGSPGQERGGTILSSGTLSLDTARYTATEDGAPLDLTYKEFEMLRLLMEHRGRVLTREMFLEQVWGIDYFGDDRVVNVHLANLRKKLRGDWIETVRGVGYKFHG